VALQYGVPLRDLVNKFAHVRFEPSGFTGNQEIPIAKSIIDYIFRWLGSRFLGPDDKAALGLVDRSLVSAEAPAFGSPAGSSFGATALAGLTPAQDEPPPAAGGATPAGSGDEPKGSSVAGASVKGSEPAAEQSGSKTGAAAAVSAVTPAATASEGSGSSSPARDELAVVASNGHAAKSSNGNGMGTVTLSLGATNVAFKIQEDAPSCAECGSIMVRNGSCYKCLNCGSTSGCS